MFYSLKHNLKTPINHKNVTIYQTIFIRTIITIMSLNYLVQSVYLGNIGKFLNKTFASLRTLPAAVSLQAYKKRLTNISSMWSSCQFNNIHVATKNVTVPKRISCKALVTSSSPHCLGAQIPQRIGNNYKVKESNTDNR